MTHTADPTYLALLCAVLREPAEDTPRLVYADWLEENARSVPCKTCEGWDTVVVPLPGNPYQWSATCSACHGTGRVSDGRRERAELIRLQIRGGDPGRERELLSEWGPRWYEEFARPIFGDPTGCASWSVEGPQPAGQMVCHGVFCVRHEPFVRGFIGRFTTTCLRWLSHATAILAAQPVRHVTFTDLPIIRAGHLSFNEPAVFRPLWVPGRKTHYTIGRLPGFRPSWANGGPSRIEHRWPVISAVYQAEWPGVNFERFEVATA